MKLTTCIATGRGNNFDLLRLFAATAVIFSHSFGLVTPRRYQVGDSLFQLTGGQMTFGELGVYIFFVASGFLIAASLRNAPTLANYWARRLLRIVPGLLFVCLCSMLLLGPLLTTLPLRAYFGNPATYTYLRNVLMFVKQSGLPGVFEHNPLPVSVNASLWTLKFEMFCYALMAGLGALKLARAGIVAALALACTVAGKYYAGPGAGYLFFSSYFLAGAALYLARDTVSLNRTLAAAAIGVLLLGAWSGNLKQAFALGGSYLVIYVAYASDHGERLRRRWGDYSYGIYLFGCPVQQGALALAGAMTWWQNFLVAYPLTLLMAILSWNLVEAPALRWRGRLSGYASAGRHEAQGSGSAAGMTGR